MSIDSKPRTASAGTSNGSSNHGHGNGHDIRNGNPTSHHHESHRDDYSESVGSSPEGDDQLSSLPAAGATSQDAQQPKRKGGRKPVSHVPLHCFSYLYQARSRVVPNCFGIPLSLVLSATRLGLGDTYPRL